MWFELWKNTICAVTWLTASDQSEVNLLSHEHVILLNHVTADLELRLGLGLRFCKKQKEVRFKYLIVQQQNLVRFSLSSFKQNTFLWRPNLEGLPSAFKYFFFFLRCVIMWRSRITILIPKSIKCLFFKQLKFIWNTPDRDTVRFKDLFQSEL